MADLLKERVFGATLAPRIDRIMRRLYGEWFAAFAWVVIVGFVVWFFQGGEGLRRPWPFMVVGFGGAIVVWLGARWWLSKPGAVILVARFVAVPEGDETARMDAALFREEVVTALQRAQGPQPVFKVNELPVPIDVALDDDVQSARLQAHERRAAVVVCGKVTVAKSGECHPQIVAITSPDQAGFPTRMGTSNQAVSVVPEQVLLDEASARSAVAAAQAAQVSAGLALLVTRRYGLAQKCFESVSPTCHLSDFYAAYAAYMAEDFKEAAKRGSKAFEQYAWAPSASISAMAYQKLGDNAAAGYYLERAVDAGTEQPGPEWDKIIRVLTLRALIGHGIAIQDTIIANTMGTESPKPRKQRD